MTVDLLPPRFVALLDPLLTEMMVDVALVRTDPATGATTTLAPQRVLVSFGDEARAGGFVRRGRNPIATALGASPTAIDGVFESWSGAAFDVAVNDAFVLDGLAGTVRVVTPLHFGHRAAGFVLETDARTAPES